MINGTRDKKGNFLKTFFGLPFLYSNEVDEKNFATKSKIFTKQKTFNISSFRYMAIINILRITIALCKTEIFLFLQSHLPIFFVACTQSYRKSGERKYLYSQRFLTSAISIFITQLVSAIVILYYNTF